jgi:hypothetical protein
LQIAYQARADFGVDREGRSSAQIDSGDGQRLVHGHDEVTGAKNAALAAQCTIEGFTKRDAYVFNSVMLVDVKIAITLESKVKRAVARKEFEHVVEEANAG